MTTDTNNAIRFDLLRKLHAFVMSIPEKQFNLDNIVEDIGDEKLLDAGAYKECGSIACGMGWAGLLPEFNQLGLVWDRTYGHLKLNGKPESYDEAAIKLFNLPPFKDVWGDEDEGEYRLNYDYYAYMLFAPIEEEDLDRELATKIREKGGDPSNHRLMFDARMRHFFGLFGESL
jgi:hypothetical protein